MLIAFFGFLIALLADAYGLARFVMLGGMIVAAVGMAWHFAILLRGKTHSGDQRSDTDS
jgi:hypothetical protein